MGTIYNCFNAKGGEGGFCRSFGLAFAAPRRPASSRSGSKQIDQPAQGRDGRVIRDTVDKKLAVMALKGGDRGLRPGIITGCRFDAIAESQEHGLKLEHLGAARSRLKAR